jgi:hypothetical protein
MVCSLRASPPSTELPYAPRLIARVDTAAEIHIAGWKIATAKRLITLRRKNAYLEHQLSA